MTISLTIAELTATPTVTTAALATAWCAERVQGMYTALDPTMPVTIRARCVADVVEVDATLRGRFGFDCSRCAEPAELTIDTEFSHHFVGPGQLRVQGDGGLAEAADWEVEAADLDDPDVSEHDGIQLDLEDLCIEQALLALPGVPLCREECLGLCLQCGSNRNTETCSCAAREEPESPRSKSQIAFAGLANLKLEQRKT